MSKYTQEMAERDAWIAATFWGIDQDSIQIRDEALAYALETPYEEAHARRERNGK